MRATILFCSTFLLAAPILAQDTIVTSNGKTISGRVMQYDVKELVYKPENGGSEQRIPREKVVSIELGQRAWLGNRDIKRARDQEGNENFNQAYTLYFDAAERMLKNKSLAKWAPQFAYWRAYQIARKNKFAKDDVTRAMDQLTVQVPDTAFLPDLWRIRIRDAWNRGDSRDALAKTKQLVEAFQHVCETKSLSDRYKFEGDMLMILVRQRLKDSTMPPKKAQEALASLEAKCEGLYPDLANRLRLEAAKSVLMTGNNDQARTMFEAIVNSGTADPETMAGAFLGLGHASWRKVPRSSKDEQEALANYMRVAILYPDANPEVVSEALYHALQAYQRWRPNATTEPRRIYTVLKTRYKDTSWANK